MTRGVALIIVSFVLVMLIPVAVKILDLSTTVGVLAFLAFSMIGIAGTQSIIDARHAKPRE